MPTIQDIARAWTTETEKDLVTAYIANGSRASGNWAEELESKITTNPKGINIKMLGAFYTQWIEEGRAPNKNQDHKKLVGFALWMSDKTTGSIYQWCKDKGISTAYAFPIAYDIGRFGYDAKPFIGDVINDESIAKLIKDIGLVFVNDVTSDLKSLFNGSK